MSVLEATFSYIKIATHEVDEWHTLSFAQKKKLMRFMMLTLFVAIAWYFYEVSVMISGNINLVQARKELNQALAQSQAMESRAIREQLIFTAEYFIAKGYAEPSEMTIIKRIRNVAEKSGKNFN